MIRIKPKIVVSGYFIWLHTGHIELFRRACELGDVIVIVNNDNQQVLKYGNIIVPLEERMNIIRSIMYVDRVIKSIDTDRSVCKTLERIQPDMFGNGGDRTSDNIPEDDICDKLGIQQVFNLGDKIQSSSQLIKNAKNGNYKFNRSEVKGI